MADNELFGNSEQLDTISRAAAIDAVSDCGICIQRLLDLPSAQPTLYGYDIKHLAFVASIMAKKGVSPEEAVTIFRDVNRVIEMMLEDMKEMQENELKQALKKPWKGEKHGTPRAVLSQKPVR